LALFEAVVSSSTASGNVGSLLTAAAGAVRRLVSPAVPLIPDRRTGDSATSTSSSGSASAENAVASSPGLSQAVPVPAAPSGSLTYSLND
jgi:hypothetical protein